MYLEGPNPEGVGPGGGGGGGGPPTGAAGGDLSGTYPNPRVGVPVSFAGVDNVNNDVDILTTQAPEGVVVEGTLKTASGFTMFVFRGVFDGALSPSSEIPSYYPFELPEVTLELKIIGGNYVVAISPASPANAALNLTCITRRIRP